MSYNNRSCNDNQNYLIKGRRPTSRVLAPPGGHTSFSLGVAPPPPPKKKVEETKPKEEVKPASTETQTTQTADKNDVAAVDEVTKAETPAKDVEKVDEQAAEEETTEQKASPVAEKPKPKQSTTSNVSSNAFASGANMNGAQVMTGRPTSRVLVPGGGGGPAQWKLG